MCLPSDALSQQLLSYMGFSYLGCGVSLHGCSSAMEPAEDIKKRWQEYTEELYKKDLHNPDYQDGLITHTHLEPDILECKVKWALGSITMNKASGGDGIQLSYFKS